MLYKLKNTLKKKGAKPFRLINYYFIIINIQLRKMYENMFAIRF